MKISIERARELQYELWREFNGVREWQQEVLKFYHQYGYVESKTGFRYYGPLDSEQVVNFLVQGPAFHTLLTNLTDVYKYMIEKDWISFISAQIHDSALFDVRKEEEDELREITTQILTTPRWKWQEIVPLEVEWKRGRNWWEVERIK